MANKITNTPIIPLLKQIDEGTNFDSDDSKKKVFQSLLASNLPTKTILYYALHVGFQRLENSLYEPFWDTTNDALNDLSAFLFNASYDKDMEDYVYEAKCQLLLYAAIAIIKMNITRRRSTHDAKMICGTICLLLLQQNKPYEISSPKDDRPVYINSMYDRYLQRMSIIVQWLPTISKVQINDIQKNHERYTTMLLAHLLPIADLRNKINAFIDSNLYGNPIDDDTTSNEFVVVRHSPVFNEKLIESHDDLMEFALTKTLNRFCNKHDRSLMCYIWTLCCMIESNRVSLGIIRCSVIREHFSNEPINFDKKPIDITSLNENDIIVFLLLCAQQNIHLNNAESILHPYLLFSSTHLCTQQQKRWWESAINKTPWNEFDDHLATIRLDHDRISQHPPNSIILKTAAILFKAANDVYEKYAPDQASAYERYALQYLNSTKTTKQIQDLSESINKQNSQGNKQDKFFFFYTTKTSNNNAKYIEQLTEECENLARQSEELKKLPVPELPKTKTQIEEPLQETKNEVASTIAAENVDPITTVQERIPTPPPPPPPPPIKITRDASQQTSIEEPPPDIDHQPDEPPLPPHAEIIFSHINNVNQWINTFCTDHEIIQNDINGIRDRLEKINRVTSQMLFTNTKFYPTGNLPH